MKTRWLFIIVPLLILALALAGGFTWLWRFFLFTAVALGISYAWPRLSARSIDGNSKKTSERRQVGETLEEEFSVSNYGRLPSALIEARAETDLPGGGESTAFYLPARGLRDWKTRVVCRRRGKYGTGAFTLKVSDPLGFFPVTRRLGERREVIVYPQTVELPFFQVLPRQAPGQSTRRWLPSETGPGAARVRDFTSGDSLRHIHWPTTAHTGRLMVKEFDPDRSNYAFKDIWIIPDMDRRTRLGTGDDSTEEHSVTLAASLAKKYIDSGKRVGLIAASERPYLFLPETGDQHLHHIFLALALMKADGKVPIEMLLASEADRFDAGSAVIFIMPSGAEVMGTSLRRAINRGAIVNALLLDSTSFGGEDGLDKTARNLISGGVNVYIVKRGAEITRALDSRFPALRV